MEINDLIVNEALRWVGSKELPGNSGFVNPDLEAKMRLAGWDTGQSWCAVFGEMVWTEAYSQFNSGLIEIIRSYCSLNAVHTYKSFERSRFPTSKKPAPGALAVWIKMRNGEPVYLTPDKFWIAGHLAICIKGYQNFFETVEGNSNNEGGREGIEVAHFKDKRFYSFDNDNGLRLLGFIHPIETIQ